MLLVNCFWLTVWHKGSKHRKILQYNSSTAQPFIDAHVTNRIMLAKVSRDHCTLYANY